MLESSELWLPTQFTQAPRVLGVMTAKAGWPPPHIRPVNGLNHSSSPKIPHWPPSHAFDEVDDGISQKVKKNDRLFLPYLSLV